MSVSDVCTRGVVTISRSETILEAARRMRAQNVGTLVITEMDGDSIVPTGIITDRDIAVGIVAVAPEHIADLLVEDVVVRDLVTVEEDTSVWEALQRMRNRRIRRMPVVDAAGYLTGILTMDDLIVRFADELSTLSQIIVHQSEVASSK